MSVFPSDSLVSETGTNLELGIQQGFRIKKLNLMLDVAVYQMKFENMMEFTFGQWGPIVPPAVGIGFKTLNTGKNLTHTPRLYLTEEDKLQNRRRLKRVTKWKSFIKSDCALFCI